MSQMRILKMNELSFFWGWEALKSYTSYRKRVGICSLNSRLMTSRRYRLMCFFSNGVVTPYQETNIDTAIDVINSFIKAY